MGGGQSNRGHLRVVRDDDPAPDQRVHAIVAAGAQLLDLRDRARETYRRRPAASFDGLSALLDEVLPEDDSLAARVATAVNLPTATLIRLRARLIDPLTVPPVTLTRLARAADLSLADLERLALLDHAATSGATNDSNGAARAPAAWARAALAELRDAWSVEA